MNRFEDPPDVWLAPQQCSWLPPVAQTGFPGLFTPTCFSRIKYTCRGQRAVRFLRLAAVGSGGKLVHSGTSFVAIGDVIKVYTAGGQMTRAESQV